MLDAERSRPTPRGRQRRGRSQDPHARTGDGTSHPRRDSEGTTVTQDHPPAQNPSNGASDTRVAQSEDRVQAEVEAESHTRTLAHAALKEQAREVPSSNNWSAELPGACNIPGRRRT